MLQMSQTGFRADWDRGRDTFTLQGDVYQGHDGQSVSLGVRSPLRHKRSTTTRSKFRAAISSPALGRAPEQRRAGSAAGLLQ